MTVTHLLSGRRPSALRPAALLLVTIALAVGCGSSGSTSSSSNAAGQAPSATSSGSAGSSGVGGTTGSTTSVSTAVDSSRPTSSSGSSSSTDPADAPRACTLITEADATAAFGEPAVAGDQRRDECWWSTKNDLKTVNVIRRTGDIDTWRSGYQNSSWTRNNLGDEGYSGLALDSIVFRVGETTYEINAVYSTRDGDPGQVVKTLADRVASRV